MTTLFADDFAGADANPIGGSYTTQPDCSDLRRLSNALRSTSSAACVAYVNSVSPPDDQYAQATVGVLSHSSSVSGVMCRASTGEKSSVNLLIVFDGTLYLQDCVNNSFSLIQSAAHAHTTGDVYRLECEGDQARGYVNDVLKVSGTTVRTTGRFGPWMQSVSADDDTITAFEAGDFAEFRARAYYDLMIGR